MWLCDICTFMKNYPKLASLVQIESENAKRTGMIRTQAAAKVSVFLLTVMVIDRQTI